MNQSSTLTRRLADSQERHANLVNVAIVGRNARGQVFEYHLFVAADATDALQIARALSGHVDDELTHMEENRLDAELVLWTTQEAL